jgi:hypothetical protein
MLNIVFINQNSVNNSNYVFQPEDLVVICSQPSLNNYSLPKQLKAACTLTLKADDVNPEEIEIDDSLVLFNVSQVKKLDSFIEGVQNQPVYVYSHIPVSKNPLALAVGIGMQVLGLPDKPLTDRQLEDLANWVANTTLETPPNLWVLEVFSAYRQSLKNTLVSFFEDYLATGILVVRTKVYQSTSPLYDYV